MESPMLEFRWKLQESKKLWSKLSAASGSSGGHVLFLCIFISIFVAAYLYLCFFVFFLLEESEKLWQNLSGCLSSVTNFIERQIAGHQKKAPQVGLARLLKKIIKKHNINYQVIIFWIFIETESCFIQWSGLFSFGLWNLFGFEKSLFCCWFSFIKRKHLAGFLQYSEHRFSLSMLKIW